MDGWVDGVRRRHGRRSVRAANEGGRHLLTGAGRPGPAALTDSARAWHVLVISASRSDALLLLLLVVVLVLLTSGDALDRMHHNAPTLCVALPDI